MAEDFSIQSLKGGQNDTDPPNALQPDECVLAENVEFFYSTLGERRNGCGPLDITGAGLGGEAAVVHISEWFPTNDITIPEFVIVAATPTTSATIAVRTAGVWSNPTLTDAFSFTVPDIYNIGTKSLNGKLFVAYKSAQDRLHVRDAGSSTVRRAGMAPPVLAPTGANQGVGAYSGTRYFRVRYITKSGSTILRRSEPSPALTFVPSGTGLSARITKPAAVNEGETHWELEGSEDNATFYIIATTVVGTTTYDDSVAFATGYSASGPLSEDVGEYLLLPSARFLDVDGDRLVFGGHYTDLTQQSQIGWTPVSNDPGVGNDERLPASVNNTVSLDNYDGGGLTGIAAATYGTWYAFKWDHIYKMVRTGDVTRAYDVITLSTARGAVPGSITKGVDENGSACVYFTDPRVGPSRVGSAGIQAIVGLRASWGRVNLQASNIIARSCYYPYKQQVHWWLAVDGSDQPNFKMVLQVSETRPTGDNAIGRGWSTWTGRITQARAVGVLTEVVSINGVASLSARPFVGLTSPDFVQRCDVEDTDAGTAYVATIRTRPYIREGLLQLWGAMTAAVMALPNTTKSIIVRLVRDMGIESASVTTDLLPVGSETLVVKNMDNLRISEAKMIQIEFTDA